MDITTYFTKIEEIASQLNDEEKSAFEILEKPSVFKSDVNELIGFRSSQITESDRNHVEGYLTIGYFINKNVIERQGAFLVGFDLEQAMAFDRLRRETEEYDSSHPFFKSEPSLLRGLHTKKKELINASLLIWGDSFFSRLAKYKKHFLLLTYYLDPFLVYWTKKHFVKAPLFVRLNPYKQSPKKIPQLLFGTSRKNYELVMEYDRIMDFPVENLLKSKKRHDLKTIQPNDDASTLNIAIDQTTKLELFANWEERKEYISFMAEELDERAANEKEYPYLIGRMVHCDAYLKNINRNATKTELKHIDLAINIYTGKAIKERLASDLSKGKTTKATRRVHLLRAEKIPMNVLVLYCYIFFKSDSLINLFLADLRR